MENIRGPQIPPAHPDRFLNCQEALDDAFRLLIGQAVVAGWNEAEVAAALVDLADCRMLAIAANVDTDRMILQAASRYGLKKT